MSETCLKTQVLGVTSRTYPPTLLREETLCSRATHDARDASDSVPSRSLSLTASSQTRITTTTGMVWMRTAMWRRHSTTFD